MKKQTKKAAPNRARIDIGVGKFRWISYDGKRINYDLILYQFDNDRDKLIRFLKEHTTTGHAPNGFYGGNLQTVAAMEAPMALLIKAGLEPQLLKKNIRFYVTIGGCAAPDSNPNHLTHEIDWKRCQGFPTRAEAETAARSRFAYYNAWCVDENKKKTNIVTLKIINKDGEVIEEKHN